MGRDHHTNTLHPHPPPALPALHTARVPSRRQLSHRCGPSASIRRISGNHVYVWWMRQGRGHQDSVNPPLALNINVGFSELFTSPPMAHRLARDPGPFSLVIAILRWSTVLTLLPNPNLTGFRLDSAPLPAVFPADPSLTEETQCSVYSGNNCAVLVHSSLQGHPLTHALPAHPV